MGKRDGKTNFLLEVPNSGFFNKKRLKSKNSRQKILKKTSVKEN
jgi:hypothetical protein